MAESKTDQRPVALTRGTVRKLKRLVEGQGSSVPAYRQSGAAPWTYGIVRARVTTAIPAGSWDSPSSSGRAQIRHKDATGAWVNSGDPVKVFNDHPLCPGTTTVAVNTVIKLGWTNGEWWLI